MNCSIVVPVHNEAANLEGFFMEFWNNLGGNKLGIIEIHFVENGSSDNTFEVCKRLEGKVGNVIISHKILYPSYGEAVKKGIMSSSGEIVCVLECDVMDNISFISSSITMIEQSKADFVIASKRHPDSVDLRPFKRRMLTYFFNQLLKIFIDFPGTDTHGLKTIRTDIAKKICEASVTEKEIFQTEMVLLAHRMGFRVAELPVHIRERRSTKVSIFKRIPKVIFIIKELRKSLARFS